MEEKKAMVLPQTYKKMCDICMLLDTEASKDMKWHLYKEGYMTEDDKYVCNDCLEGLKDLRKKMHQKVDNPHHKVLDGWMPWFAAEVPGLVQALSKQNV